MFFAAADIAEASERINDIAGTADCLAPYCLCNSNLLSLSFCDVFTLRFAQMDAQLPPGETPRAGSLFH